MTCRRGVDGRDAVLECVAKVTQMWFVIRDCVGASVGLMTFEKVTKKKCRRAKKEDLKTGVLEEGLDTFQQ